MELNDNVEIFIEMVPILSFFNNNYLIKLPDTSYGEWLIFKEKKPVFYLNIFEPQYKEIKTIMDSTGTTIKEIIKTINHKLNENYSIEYKYFGLLNYGNVIRKTICIQKFPVSYLNYIR